MLVKIRSLLNLEDSTSEEVLSFYLDLITDKVLNFCHRDDIPKGLENIIIQMVIEEFKALNKQDIKSIKRGDISVEFAASVVKRDITETYKKQLYNFRKLKTL